MSGAEVVHRHTEGSDDFYDVIVPTERGDKCMVSVYHDRFSDVWEIKVSGELLRMAPEAITAVMQLTVIALAAHFDGYPASGGAS